MKNTICLILLLLISGSSTFGQNIYGQFNFYSKIRLSQDDYLINQFLKPELEIKSVSFIPSMVSLECFINNYSLELGLGVSMSRLVRDGYGYGWTGTIGTLDFKYNIDRADISLGVSVAYERVSLAVFSNNTAIDLASGFQSSLVQLENSFLFLGPVINYQFAGIGKHKNIFTFGYLIGINSSDWSSSYTNLSHPLREIANNHFYAGVGLPIGVVGKSK